MVCTKTILNYFNNIHINDVKLSQFFFSLKQNMKFKFIFLLLKYKYQLQLLDNYTFLFNSRFLFFYSYCIALLVGNINFTNKHNYLYFWRQLLLNRFYHFIITGLIMQLFCINNCRLNFIKLFISLF